MRKRRLASILFLAAMGFTASRTPAQDLSQPLPVDPQVTLGKLENGVRYYIRANSRPEKRAEFRLVVNAGSILEDEDQQGLAHFVEHMAFNGTRNFPKRELVNYLQSIGLRFGPHLNASTGFDETVYNLQIPTGDDRVLEQAIQVLEDWAHNLSFDADEIERERGVVVEEWRLGRGAQSRLLDKFFPVLFKGSRYAERLPIGQKAVLDAFSHETLRRFYRDWYRPDLMAVIAVGDFDRARVEGLIRQYFSRMPPVEKGRERTVFPVPDHQETLIAIATDPEIPNAFAEVDFKLALRKTETLGDYQQGLVEALAAGALNQRLVDLANKPDGPFLFGYAGQGRLVRSRDALSLGAAARPGGIETALEALLTEAARARQVGFTRSELELQKKALLRAVDQAYTEQTRTESQRFVSSYLVHFLFGEPIPGIEYEFQQVQKLLPEIGPEEVGQVARAWVTDQNRVILAGGPSSGRTPTESDLRAVIDRVKGKVFQPVEEDLKDIPLISKFPSPAEVVSEKQIADLGVTEWRLANGVRVLLKPTDFKTDEILFTAYSPGGHSLVPDEDYISALTATSVVLESGIGAFNKTDLPKKLAGTLVQVSPRISELDEGMSGSASARDVSTLFQLIYLYFTGVRQDSLAFQTYQDRLRGLLENAGESPEAAFGDTLQATMTQYHPRVRPLSASRLKEMDFRKSLEIYRDRFADASDFTFFFVGNIFPDQVKSLVQTYLGGLPSLRRTETWKDRGVRPPSGVVKKTVRRGIEPKSQTQIVFTGKFEWNPQNRYDLSALVRWLNIRLLEVLREDLGKTYSVSAGASTSHYPEERYQVAIAFGSAPERAEELAAVVFAQIDSLKRSGVPGVDLPKVREQLRLQRETDLRTNGFWLNSLQFYDVHQEDPLNVYKFDAMNNGLTSETIQKAAQRYLDPQNYVQVVLLPREIVGDFNGDGEVNFEDFFLFAAVFGQKAASDSARYDLDGDGEIGFGDFFLFAQDFGRSSRGSKLVSKGSPLR